MTSRLLNLPLFGALALSASCSTESSASPFVTAVPVTSSPAGATPSAPLPATATRPTVAIDSSSTPSAFPLPPGSYVGLLTADAEGTFIEAVDVSSGQRFTLNDHANMGTDASVHPHEPILVVTLVDPSILLPPRTILALLDLRDGSLRPFPRGRGCLHPTWSPDGIRILAVCLEEDPSLGLRSLLVVIPSLDGDRLPVPGPDRADELISPGWSPDDRWLTYVVVPGGQIPGPKQGLYLLSADCASSPNDCASAVTRLAEGEILEARWSPRGSALAYSIRDTLMLWSLAEGQTAQFTLPSTITSLAWSPRGDAIAVTTSPTIGSSMLYFVTVPKGEISLLLYLPEAYARFWVTVE